jgi:hypothetical protein
MASEPSIDPRHFYFPVLAVDATGKPEALCGNAFPVSAAGDLLTCRHVVADHGTRDLVVVDRRNGMRGLRVNDVRTPADEKVDLACLPGLLGQGSRFFPLLTPGELMVGEDVTTYGFYTHGAGLPGLTDGYFKGHVVGFRTEPQLTTLLSYPIIEGLSGSPVAHFHNGQKVVGVCQGSEDQRVIARETIEYKDTEREIHERIERVVEFGIASRVETVISLCEEVGVSPVVSSEMVPASGQLG